MLQKRDAVQGLKFGVTYHVDEVLDRLRSEAATAHTRYCRHSGIVPSCHKALLYELQELALAHYRIGEIESVELYLSGTIALVGQLLDEVFIQRTVRHKLKGAYRVSNPLKVVALTVCEVIHRVYLPFCTCAVMGILYYTIHYRVTEVHIGRCHVDFGTKHIGAFLKLASIHALEKVEILLYRTITIRTVYTGLCRRTLLTGNLLRCLVVDIGLALFYHAYGQIIQLGEIVARVILAVAPVKSKPMNVLSYGVDILDILLCWVGIIKTQIAGSSKFLGYTKVHAYSLGVSNVKIAVGFRWKTRIEASAILTGCEVIAYYLLYKVKPSFFFSDFFSDFRHSFCVLLVYFRYKISDYL